MKNLNGTWLYILLIIIFLLIILISIANLYYFATNGQVENPTDNQRFLLQNLTITNIILLLFVIILIILIIYTLMNNNIKYQNLQKESKGISLFNNDILNKYDPQMEKDELINKIIAKLNILKSN